MAPSGAVGVADAWRFFIGAGVTVTESVAEVATVEVLQISIKTLMLCQCCLTHCVTGTTGTVVAVTVLVDSI